VPSNKRQRELARRRAERQAARRAAERAARRKRNLRLGLGVGGGALAVVLILVLVAVFKGDGKDTVEAAAFVDQCQATSEGGNSGGKNPGMPPGPASPGTKSGTLTLNKGTVEMALFADKAPCTVGSFQHLTGSKFFDGTVCHRQTNTPGLVVLQCGDPTGSGGGGPGYKFKDENLPTAGPDGNAKYPRGTVAMANSGAGSNGSQFFLVIKDSTLPPNYTVFGQITKGMDVLDAIHKTGIKDKAPDGAPAQEVTITSFVISETPPATNPTGTPTPTGTPAPTASTPATTPSTKPSASAS
jgi:peptidyl-prolyl cis-trans isomerase B (cyclophilin B)